MADQNSKDDVFVYHAPKYVSLPRPSADLPLKTLKPIISSTLVQQMSAISLNSTNGNNISSLSEIPIGTMCKNKGCKQVLLINVFL